LNCFDEAVGHSQKIPTDDSGLIWYTSMIAMYRPMALHAMGKNQEAKSMFLKTVKSVEIGNDPDQPYKGRRYAESREMTVFLAHREAAQIFGIDSPRPGGL
jgi:hypothetical protein